MSTEGTRTGRTDVDRTDGTGRTDDTDSGISVTSQALAVSERPVVTNDRSAGRAWTKWLLRRALFAIGTLWLVSVVVFLATSALGDPVRAILGKDFAVSPDRVAMIRDTLNLDKSLPERYFLWLGGLLQGDLGTSVVNGIPVGELIGGKVANSAFLVLIVALFMVPMALGLAMLSARFRGGPVDNIIRFFTLAFAGVPEFVTGILLVAIFSTSVFHLLPAVTVLPVGSMAWERPSAMVLPVLTLLIALVPYLTRILRANMLEIVESDYVELARLKGIPEGKVLSRHVLPNTVVPTIQVTALQLAWLLGGVVLIEYLFNFPGIGAALVDSVRNSDFPVVQALTMIIAAGYVVVNLIADILSILFTPRARTGMVA